MDEHEIAEMVYDGVMALLRGDKEQAQELLLQVVEADEENEEAWLWLSGAVDTADDQMIALENVLALNPDNQYARMGLELLQQG